MDCDARYFTDPGRQAIWSMQGRHFAGSTIMSVGNPMMNVDHNHQQANGPVDLVGGPFAVIESDPGPTLALPGGHFKMLTFQQVFLPH